MYRKHSSSYSAKTTIIYMCMVVLMIVSTLLPLLFVNKAPF
jgi:uncharacterized membrane protein